MSSSYPKLKLVDDRIVSNQTYYVQSCVSGFRLVCEYRSAPKQSSEKPVFRIRSKHPYPFGRRITYELTTRMDRLQNACRSVIEQVQPRYSYDLMGLYLHCVVPFGSAEVIMLDFDIIEEDKNVVAPHIPYTLRRDALKTISPFLKSTYLLWGHEILYNLNKCRSYLLWGHEIVDEVNKTDGSTDTILSGFTSGYVLRPSNDSNKTIGFREKLRKPTVDSYTAFARQFEVVDDDAFENDEYLVSVVVMYLKHQFGSEFFRGTRSSTMAVGYIMDTLQCLSEHHRLTRLDYSRNEWANVLVRKIKNGLVIDRIIVPELPPLDIMKPRFQKVLDRLMPQLTSMVHTRHVDFRLDCIMGMKFGPRFIGGDRLFQLLTHNSNFRAHTVFVIASELLLSYAQYFYYVKKAAVGSYYPLCGTPFRLQVGIIGFSQVLHMILRRHKCMKDMWPADSVDKYRAYYDLLLDVMKPTHKFSAERVKIMCAFTTHLNTVLGVGKAVETAMELNSCTYTPKYMQEASKWFLDTPLTLPELDRRLNRVHIYVAFKDAFLNDLIKNNLS